MWYRKNIYTWEQGLRILASLGMIAFGATAAWGTPRGYAMVASGAGLLISGVVGFCPACALFGRKLEPKLPSR